MSGHSGLEIEKNSAVKLCHGLMPGHSGLEIEKNSAVKLCHIRG